MADVFSPGHRSFVMSRILSKGNASTEKRLIAIMHRHRLAGWRRNYPVVGRPDFVFPKSRVAVFVDGCFWHCCPLHGHTPASNQGYWIPKLARNKRRDRRVTRELRGAGWKVIRLWQHDLAGEARIARRLRSALSKAEKLLRAKASAGIKGAPQSEPKFHDAPKSVP